MLETSSCNQPVFSELITTQKGISKWCRREQSLLKLELQIIDSSKLYSSYASKLRKITWHL